MSSFQIAALAIGCFVEGFIACAFFWSLSRQRQLARFAEEVDAESMRIEEQVRETEASIAQGARRSKGRFRL